MRKHLLLVCYLLTIQTLFGQSIKLKGIVIDEETSFELVGVSLIIDNTKFVQSDENGKFVIELSAGKHTVKSTYVGYNNFFDTLNLTNSSNILYRIRMTPVVQELKMVVVSASKFERNISEETVSINILKPSLIQNTNSITMDEAINRVPGVNIIDGQANIRGGSGYSYGAGSRVLVLVDDLPQLSADAGDVKWEFLPVENLEQVEIIKGAASTLYGSSALNGVINIRTSYPTAVPQTQISFYQGIYQNPRRKELIWWDNRQPSFSGGYFTHSRKIGQLDLVVGGNINNQDSYLQESFQYRGRVNTNLRYRFKKIDGLSVGINTNYLYAHTGTFFIWANDSTGGYRPLGGTDSATTSITKNRYYRFNIDPFVNYVAKNKDLHSLRTRMFETNNMTNQATQSSKSRLWYAEYQYQHEFKFGLHMTAGAMANYTQVFSTMYDNHDGSNQALYLQLDYKWEKLTLMGGVRYEHYSIDTFQDNSGPVFRTGINYALTKGTHVRASFGQGFRFPSVAEKFVHTNVGALYVYPNPQLGPEQGWSVEVGAQQGFKISNWMGYVDIAAFRQLLNHFMEFSFGQWGNPFTDPQFGLGFKSVNLDKAQITGLEATLFGQGKLFGCPVNILGGYTFINPIDLGVRKKTDSLISAHPDFSQTEIDSLRSLSILKYRYTTTFKFDGDITWKIVTAGINMRYNSYMVNIDKFLLLLNGIEKYRAEHKNGDFVIDIRFGVKVNKNTRVSFIVKNLMNREYTTRPALLEGPRNYTIQINTKF